MLDVKPNEFLDTGIARSSQPENQTVTMPEISDTDGLERLLAEGFSVGLNKLTIRRGFETASTNPARQSLFLCCL